MDFEEALRDESLGILADPTTPDEPPATLLIAFGGLASRLDGIPPFEFLSALSGTEARRVFIRDLNQSWYQEGVRGVSTTLAATTTALRALVAESGAQRVVTLGVSAGGFAAIYFGCQLEADFVPTPIEIHYGRRSRVDRAHARRLRRFEHVTLIEHDAGHNPAKALKDAGELDTVLRRAVAPPA